MSLPRRLRRLPSRELPGGACLVIATTARSRLLGLMGLEALHAGQALLLPRCKSVHTFGMRFALDLVWIDVRGRVVSVDVGVAPGRLRNCRRAHGVVEAPAGSGERLAAALAAASGAS